MGTLKTQIEVDLLWLIEGKEDVMSSRGWWQHGDWDQLVIINILSSTIFVVVSRILSTGAVSTAVLMQHCKVFTVTVQGTVFVITVTVMEISTHGITVIQYIQPGS